LRRIYRHEAKLKEIETNNASNPRLVEAGLQEMIMSNIFRSLLVAGLVLGGVSAASARPMADGYASVTSKPLSTRAFFEQQQRNSN
jgi:hypothetical protein